MKRIFSLPIYCSVLVACIALPQETQAQKAGNKKVENQQTESKKGESSTQVIDEKSGAGVTTSDDLATLKDITAKLVVTADGSYNSPLLLIPASFNPLNDNAWAALIDRIKSDETTPVRSVVIQDVNTKENVAIAINSPEGLQNMAATKLKLKVKVHAVPGVPAIDRVADARFKKYAEKHALSKITGVLNSGFKPGEYGPMRAPLSPADNVIKE